MANLFAQCEIALAFQCVEFILPCGLLFHPASFSRISNTALYFAPPRRPLTLYNIGEAVIGGNTFAARAAGQYRVRERPKIARSCRSVTVAIPSRCYGTPRVSEGSYRRLFRASRSSGDTAPRRGTKGITERTNYFTGSRLRGSFSACSIKHPADPASMHSLRLRAPVPEPHGLRRRSHPRRPQRRRARAAR